MKKIEISKRSGIVITGVVILSAISLFFLSTYIIKPLSLPLISTSKKFDKFGIMEFYPTKAGGREWFINMENPTSDGIFNPQSNLSRQQDGSWRITGKLTTGKFYDEVRMNVNTPTGVQNWKNVEITGYAKVNSIIVPFNGTPNDDLTWYACHVKVLHTWVASMLMVMSDGRRKFGLQVDILPKEPTQRLQIL
jgi:hypothetical protein